MNEMKKLIRDLRRCKHVMVVEKRRCGHLLKVRAADGTGPVVYVTSSGSGDARTLPNTVAALKRHGYLPEQWARR